MERGKHARRRFGGRRWPVVLLIVAGFLVLVGGSAYAAYRYDLATAGRIMPGVTIAGVDVGGMTEEQAEAATVEAIRPRLETPIALKAGGRTWTTSAEGLGLRASVGGAVTEALAADDSMSFLERVFDRITERPLGRSIELEYSVRTLPIKEFTERIAEKVAVEPRNAAVLLDGDELEMRHPKEGRALRVDASVERVRAAVAGQLPSVTLPTEPVRPDVSVSDLGYAILVNRAENQLYVYRGFELHDTYDVATGTPEYETPSGEWSIIDKQENPSWVNPAPDGWGAGLPAVIPGGPGSPLGTRALYLDAPGIRIHGTYDVDSIGTAASHGCIRMLIADVEELYDYIPIGTKVFVV